MYYDSDFARSFMRRTLDIAQDYRGPYDATLLINCLLGLLVIPNEKLINKVPDDPLSKIEAWGISSSSIINSGKCSLGHKHELNVRQIIRQLRNSVAHFRIEPIQREGEVIGYSFKDRSGFHAELSVSELKLFVSKLAAYLEKNA